MSYFCDQQATYEQHVTAFISLQNQLIRTEEEKEKGEGDLHRQGRDLELLQHAVDKSSRERENMQAEMDMLLDRINKMSDMLDKSRVRSQAIYVN